MIARVATFEGINQGRLGTRTPVALHTVAIDERV
jgi:hypothetical protein